MLQLGKECCSLGGKGFTGRHTTSTEPSTPCQCPSQCLPERLSLQCPSLCPVLPVRQASQYQYVWQGPVSAGSGSLPIVQKHPYAVLALGERARVCSPFVTNWRVPSVHAPAAAPGLPFAA